jgi:hypothetical protein
MLYTKDDIFGRGIITGFACSPMPIEMIVYGFTSRSRIFHLYGDVTIRPFLGAQGLWAGRDLCRATPAVTRDLGLSGLIRRTASFSRLLRHTRGCRESILTQILTGLPNLKRFILYQEVKKHTADIARHHCNRSNYFTPIALCHRSLIRWPCECIVAKMFSHKSVWWILTSQNWIIPLYIKKQN